MHTSQPQIAVDIFRQASALAPRNVEPKVNLGHALKARGRYEEAIAAYQGAVRQKPLDGQLRYALANGHIAAGDYVAAEAELRQALRLAPRFAAAYNNLGHVLRQLGRPAEAEACLREAIALTPSDVGCRLNLALALGEQQRVEETLDALRDVLALAPDNCDALHARGTLLVRSRRFADAVSLLRRLRVVQPGIPDPFAGLSQALTALGRFEEALEVADDTVRRMPNNAGAWSNLGAVKLSLGRLAEAKADYDAALRLDPDYAFAKSGRAFTLLRQGRFEEAWDDYEARFDAQRMVTVEERVAAIDPESLDGSAWDGGPRTGRSLLVYPEQGLGDVIQMIRYAPVLAKDGPAHWLVWPSLRRLLAATPGVASVSTAQENLPEYELHCPIMSLPRLCRTSLATIPCTVPYVFAPAAEVKAWRQRLASFSGTARWPGMARYPGYLLDALRSIPMEELEPLGRITGVTFVSLQLPRPDTPPPLPMIDMTEELHDFAATAALIEALDLVISVDTSIAHLAGALGRPVWLLNRFNTDWRWLQDREDSPWYPPCASSANRRPAIGIVCCAMHARPLAQEASARPKRRHFARRAPITANFSLPEILGRLAVIARYATRTELNRTFRQEPARRRSRNRVATRNITSDYDGVHRLWLLYRNVVRRPREWAFGWRGNSGLKRLQLNWHWRRGGTPPTGSDGARTQGGLNALTHAGCLPKRCANAQGFALVIVQVSLTVLGLVATRLTSAGRTQLRLAAAQRSSAAAEAAADGAIQRAMFILLDRNHPRELTWRVRARIGASKVNVFAEDQSTKLNPNSVSRDILRSLLVGVGLDQPYAAQLSGEMVDWRLRGENSLLGGQKIDLYRAGQLPYQAGEHPFYSMHELALVPDMTLQVFACLEPWLSVYQEGSVADADNASPVAIAVSDARTLRAGRGAIPFTTCNTTVRLSAAATSPNGQNFVRLAVVRLKIAPGSAQLPGGSMLQVLSWH